MRFDVRNKKPKLWNAAILTAAAAGLIAVLLIRDAEKNALAVSVILSVCRTFLNTTMRDCPGRMTF